MTPMEGNTMPRRVYFTHGDYAGRYLVMEDDEASAAVSGGFALEAEEDIDPATVSEHVENAGPDVIQASRDFFNQRGNPGAAAAAGGKPAAGTSAKAPAKEPAKEPAKSPPADPAKVDDNARSARKARSEGGE